MSSTTTRKPPIHCTPCRVTYEGVRYQIEANGEVRTLALDSEIRLMPSIRFADGRIRELIPEPESVARLVRHEASRQRRNRTARERTQTMKDLGLRRGAGGAFGGWE